MEGNIGVFAMPGSEAGTTAPVFLGGSNIGIPANSENQELAYDLHQGPGVARPSRRSSPRSA